MAAHREQGLTAIKAPHNVRRRVDQLPGVGFPELLCSGSVKGCALVPGCDQLGPAAVDRKQGPAH